MDDALGEYHLRGEAGFTQLNYLKVGGSEMKRIMSFLRDEEGATAVEYGIMVAAIAAVIITIVIAVGNKTLGAFTKVDTAMAPLQ